MMSKGKDADPKTGTDAGIEDMPHLKSLTVDLKVLDIKSLNTKGLDLKSLTTDTKALDLKSLTADTKALDLKSLTADIKGLDLKSLTADIKGLDLKSLTADIKGLDLKSLTADIKGLDLKSLTADIKGLDLADVAKVVAEFRKNADLGTVLRDAARLVPPSNQLSIVGFPPRVSVQDPSRLASKTSRIDAESGTANEAAAKARAQGFRSLLESPAFWSTLPPHAKTFLLALLLIVFDQAIRDFTSAAMDRYVLDKSDTQRAATVRYIQNNLGESASDYLRVVNASSLRVRASNRKEALVLDMLPRGSLVEVIEFRGAWAQILYRVPQQSARRLGWVSSGHLSRLETVSRSPN